MARKHKKRKRYHEPGHFHELTFSCYRQMKLLTNDEWRAELARLLNASLETASLDLTAFVFMPEHIHLLVYPRLPNPDIGQFLSSFKQPFSSYVKDRLTESGARLLEQLTIRERPGKMVFRYWQEGGGFDRNMFEPSTVENAINYIHMNPVRRNLVQKADDWRWSSARFYLLGETNELLPTITPPPAEFFTSGGVQNPHI